MMRVVAVLALLSLASAATITKKDGYGGGGQSAASYGSSYDATSYSNADSYGNGNSGALYYGGSSHTGGSSSYGGTADASSGASGSGDSFGNLYYYYYPVTNHSSSGHASGGPTSYGGGNPGYGPAASNSGGYGSSGYGSNTGGGYGSQSSVGYPGGYYPPPAPYGNDPFGGLLTSVIGSIDINSLILPALLIGGVALLLPAILGCNLALGTCVIPLPTLGATPLAGGRRNRRDLEELTDEQLTITQMIEHAYRIYEAVHEGEQCMQRVVCEVGGMLRNVRGKDTFFSVMDNFVSPSVKKQLYVLRQGASQSMDDDHSSCETYICGKIDNKID